MVSKEAILRRVSDDGIEFVNLQFTDIVGLVKSVTIPVAELVDDVAPPTAAQPVGYGVQVPQLVGLEQLGQRHR